MATDHDSPQTPQPVAPPDDVEARARHVVEGVFADAPVNVDTAWATLGRQLDGPIVRVSAARLPRIGKAASGSVGRLRTWRLVGVSFGTVGLLAFGYLVAVLLHPATQPFREIASAPGSRTSVTLRDGTRVVLGPNSHLRVPAAFGRDDRTVDLEGEAVLSVTHDARHPFAVRTRQALIRDVGTVFLVQAYAGDPEERVAVREGVVAVGAARATPILHPGDMVTIQSGALTIAHGVDFASLSAWTQGQLVFKETPLRDAVRDIGRAFGTTITVADSTLLSKRVTATFAGQSLDEALNEVTQIVGAHYDRTPHGIVIRRGLAITAPGARHGSPLPLTTVQRISLPPRP